MSERIIAACIEVHKTLGPGFREIIYQRALALELEVAGLDFSREVDVPIFYKGRRIGTRRADFVVNECILELKAKVALAPEDYIQTANYVHASNYQLGLLVNFGAARIEVKRIANTISAKPA